MQGEAAEAVLRQPKRLALLAYLAVANPRGFHRRDRLLALFWPELDTAHARAALRRALYFLRQHLGDSIITGRGDEEVGVDLYQLQSDVAAFEEALARDRAEEALSHYRGDLLAGLYVADAPEFERWLEQERAALRSRAALAAWTLAERDQAAGAAASAITWARHAAELTPYDEDGLRRLISLLDQLGERPAALQAYQNFAERLRADFDLEPSAATAAMVAAIRGSSAAAAAQPRPAAGPQLIAVLPFTVRGSPELQYLGDGMVDLLSTHLDGAGDLRTVEPRALLAWLAHEAADRDSDFASVRSRLMERFGADHLVSGTLVEAGGRLQLTATLSDAAGTRVAAGSATGTGESALFDLVDEVTRQLLVGRLRGPTSALARLATRTTDSFAALKSYLRGEAAFRLNQFFDAADAYQRAVAEDPEFALAYYRLAAALAAGALPGPAIEASEAAHQRRHRLPEHARQLLDAQRAWLHGAVRDAESRYTAIVGRWREDTESWFHLGDLLFHANPMRGRSCVESRAPFRRVLELEPNHIGALVHLLRIAALDGQRDEVQILADRMLALSPDADQALPIRALRAHLLGTSADRQAIADVLPGSRVLTAAIAFADIALYARDLPGAEAVARLFVREVRTPELRALCRCMLAHLAVARGRWREAAEELDRARLDDQVLALETRGWLAALPFIPASSAELGSIHDELLGWDGTARPSHNVALAMHNGLHPLLREYLLALLDARLGRIEAADARARALSEMAVPPEGETLRWNLARGAAAAAQRAAGRSAEALEQLVQVRDERWFQLTVGSPFHAQAHERFLRAELLAELGQVEEALGWYASLAERSPYELAFRAPSDLRQAELLLQKGERTAARRHLALAAAAWHEAALPLRGEIERVSVALGE
ncbi:MAG TPA: BTAD domain-containing putative transcriptional regulator [Gemmatimonadales bacterium]|nr:BTAD domain-containing putative transcriptional regulator [Gemmatimonadales bacterium]